MQHYLLSKGETTYIVQLISVIVRWLTWHILILENHYIKKNNLPTPVSFLSASAVSGMSSLQRESWAIDKLEKGTSFCDSQSNYLPLVPCKLILASQYLAKVSMSESHGLRRYLSYICDILHGFGCLWGPVAHVKYPNVSILGSWWERERWQSAVEPNWFYFCISLKMVVRILLLKSSDFILWFNC